MRLRTFLLLFIVIALIAVVGVLAYVRFFGNNAATATPGDATVQSSEQIGCGGQRTGFTPTNSYTGDSFSGHPGCRPDAARWYRYSP